jgi:hypothetical protein
MHSFIELLEMSTSFTLNAMHQTAETTLKALENSGSTALVKATQMLSFQRVVMAVGMFSFFEAILQDRLDCKSGFEEARRILDQHAQGDLKAQFADYHNAINVLKHGRGRSYELLCHRATELPFRIKGPEEQLFNEGDVSEISTLIQVDDQFIEGCAGTIVSVARAIQNARPDVLL